MRILLVAKDHCHNCAVVIFRDLKTSSQLSVVTNFVRSNPKSEGENQHLFRFWDVCFAEPSFVSFWKVVSFLGRRNSESCFVKGKFFRAFGVVCESCFVSPKILPRSQGVWLGVYPTCLPRGLPRWPLKPTKQKVRGAVV